MTQLLIDLGNSFAKYAMYKANTLSTVKKIAAESFEKQLPLIHDTQSEPLQGILLVSVADELYTQNIINKLAACFECSVQRIQTQQSAFGVSCGYRDYRQLGDDRWLVMLAAFNAGHQNSLNLKKQSSPLVIVDSGSVVTIDVVNGSGQHIGGWMIPNSQLMSASLGQKSTAIEAALQQQDISYEDDGNKAAMQIGRTTRECVEVGSVLAVVGFIEQCFSQLKKQYTQTPLCFLTGGGAEEIISLLSMRVEYRRNLVLDGLSLFIE